MARAERAPSPETREARLGMAVAHESRAHHEHPDRNEDAVLGDVARIDRELKTPPKLHTNDVARDQRTIADAQRKERQYADALRALEVNAVFDGVGGNQNGSGAIASRLASAEIAATMAGLAADADADASRAKLFEALQAADHAILAAKKDRPDLAQMSTTAVLTRTVRGPDGNTRVAWAHSGDSRLYHYSKRLGTLVQVNRDQTALTAGWKKGELTDDEYEQLNKAKSIGALPKNLHAIYGLRNHLSGALGDKTSVPPESGTFEVEDGDVVLQVTDGLSDNLDEEDMLQTLQDGGGMAELVVEASMFGASGNKAAGAKPDDVTGLELRFAAEQPPKSGTRRKRGAPREVPPVSAHADPAIAKLSKEYQDGAARAEQLQEELGVWSDDAREALSELRRTGKDADAAAAERADKLRELAETHDRLKRISDQWKDTERAVRERKSAEEKSQLQSVRETLHGTAPAETESAPAADDATPPKKGNWFTRLFTR